MQNEPKNTKPPTPVEDDPYVGGEKVTPEPQWHEDLVAGYRLFNETYHPDMGVIYHPCGATDVSPSKAFPGTRVIYADIDSSSMRALADAGYEAHTVSALEFNPGPVDVLIMLNPQISHEMPASCVKKSGYTVANDYHSTATELFTDPAFELVGILRRMGNGQWSLDVSNMEQYWEEIATDEEFRAAPFSWGAVHSSSAELVVKAVTGKTENLLEEYKKIIQTARDQARLHQESLRQEYPDVPIELDDGELYMLEVDGKHIPIDARLPRKKGTADDLFVFRKR